jgi:hypothetical protein
VRPTVRIHLSDVATRSRSPSDPLSDSCFVSFISLTIFYFIYLLSPSPCDIICEPKSPGIVIDTLGRRDPHMSAPPIGERVPPSNEHAMIFELVPTLDEVNKILRSIPGCKARYYLAGYCPAGWFRHMSSSPDIIACNSDDQELPILPIHTTVEVKTHWSVTRQTIIDLMATRVFKLVESFYRLNPYLT